MTESQLTGLALKGLRVVDTANRQGLAAARLLADLGAEVIRVDRTSERLRRPP